MSSVYIVWNPTSGSGAGNSAYQKVTAELDARGIAFSSGMTEYRGHATKLVENAVKDGFKRVIVLGGDGTIRESAIPLVNTDVVIGIIPCGSGNDLVRPLGIPSDVSSALDFALSDTFRKMDVGLANDKLFFNAAGFGFDVDVLENMDLFRQKGFKGSFAYLLGLFKSLSHLTLRHCEIRTPEGEMTKNALLVCAANGTHIGGGMNVAPGSDPFDGKFNVCILHDVTSATVPALLAKFLRGKHTESKHCTYFQTTQLDITCEPESMLELDGEIMKGTPVSFKLLPGALLLAGPRTQE